MTNHLDKQATVIGFPASKLRAVLRSWDRSGRGFRAISEISEVSVAPGVAAALLGEAFEHKLIGFVDEEMNEIEGGGLGLTRAGLALIDAKKRGRTDKVKAAAIVDALLTKAQSLMADELAPSKVERIWLFGSFIDPGKGDVGDVDLVVESYMTRVVPREETYLHVRKHYPGILPENLNYWQKLPEAVAETFLLRSLYGPRRHPLLAPNDIETLRSLHRPCALAFDRTRGGIVEPIRLDHHPESEKRGEHIQERLVLPDLGVPSEAFRFVAPMVVDRMFSPHSTMADFDHMRWTKRNMGDSFSLGEGVGPSLQVSRKCELGSRNWDYTLNVAVADPLGEENRWIWIDLAERLIALAHADLVRMANHRNDIHGMQEIFGELEFTDVAENHPFNQAVTDCVSDVFGGWHGRSEIAPGHAFGIDLACEGTGAGLVGPGYFEEDDWRRKEGILPFTKADYEEWARPKPGEPDWKRYLPVDEVEDEA